MNKALLIGINYTGTRNELRGCHNDVNNVLTYLKERFAVVNVVQLSSLGTSRDTRDVDNANDAPHHEEETTACGRCLPKRKSKVRDSPGLADLKEPEPLDNLDMAGETLEVVVLTDNQVGLHNPTKQHILNGFHWLTRGATSESHLFFHYSGHGSHQRDRSGDEEDGQDESLVPVDFHRAGCLIDDDVRRHLVDPLPEGCNLRMILDCCHSGSGSDLKYCYRDVDVLRNDSRPHTNARQHETKCDVISWSGCMDKQTSADAWISGKYAGALTTTFLEIMRDPHQDKSYEAIYQTLLQRLKKNGYTQRPQLSAGKVVNLAGEFDLF